MNKKRRNNSTDHKEEKNLEVHLQLIVLLEEDLEHILLKVNEV